MVAGGCFGFDSRTGEQEEISLGTWQVRLGRALQNYLIIVVPDAANGAAERADTG